MQASTEGVNFYICTMIGNDIPCTKIHELLVTTWGDNVISLRQVQRIAKDFKDGTRQSSYKRQPGSGRPRTSRTVENIAAVSDLIEEDPNISLSHLSTVLNLDDSTVHRILKEDLKKVSVYARWIPYKLSDEQKIKRVTGAQNIIDQINGGVVVIDEKWIYRDHLPPPQNVRSWQNVDYSQGDRPSIPRRGMSSMKFHIIVGINFRGDHYFEVLEKDETVNSERYVAFLGSICNVRRPGTLTIMHDNATPHTAVNTFNYIHERGINLIRQPAYSPDMNLCDRMIFRNMEVSRKGIVLHNRESVKNFLTEYLGNFSRYSLTRELSRLLEDLHKIINNNGAYL